MLSRLMYITLTLLLAINLSAQQSYVIDSVCVGSERTYRIDSDQGSTYDWFILDTLGNTLDSPADIIFPGVAATNDTSEINYTWTTVGEFDIVVTVTTANDCDTLEQGRVKVYESPFAEAGPDLTFCSTPPV